jgi:hypothetical protein
MLVKPFDAVEEVESIDDQAYQCLDNRGTQDPIPLNLEYYLTDVQLQSLQHLEDFGWHLAFVRRPLFEMPTVVLLSPEGKQHACLDDDGSLNLEPLLILRVA